MEQSLIAPCSEYFSIIKGEGASHAGNEDKVKLVITIPVYNERDNLKKAVESVEGQLSKIKKRNYQIVIIDDASTDGTDKNAELITSKYSKITYIRTKRRLGRGKSLTEAWKMINGDIYIYIDCDLATDMSFFTKLIEYVENGFDVVTGSRYVCGALVRRPILRMVVSKAYNFFIRSIFHDDVYDHQCGFKAFSKRFIKEQLDKCKASHWFWDTEVIVLAKRKGYRIKEFPVKWHETKYKRTSIRRLISDILDHSKSLIRFLSESKLIQE